MLAPSGMRESFCFCGLDSSRFESHREGTTEGYRSSYHEFIGFVMPGCNFHLSDYESRFS